MAYQVIARKYRPQRFGDVVGQEHVTQTLANAIRQKRIAHAYLFVGPRGTGKTTIARIFGKCLRCERAPTAEPCNECSECRAISEGRSLDMLEFDAASNTQVEKIRDIIIDHVKYAPASGEVKLYLVDEVHMLSNSSFNALLKTLEEPPPYVKFLFATTDPEKVPLTILSRCQRFDLRRVPSALIVKHLGWIAQQESVEIDEAALYAIARGADGGMRDAESTLDQLISFCGNKIVEADVLSMFGLAARDQIFGLAQSILNAEAEGAFRELNELAKSGKDLGRLLADLLSHFRNLLLFQISKGDLGLMEVSEAEASALAGQAKLAKPEALSRIMEIFTECEGQLRTASSKRILIEVTLLKAVQARNAMPIDAVLKKLQALRDGAANSDRAATVGQPRPAPAPKVLDASAPIAERASSTSLGPTPGTVAASVTPSTSPKFAESSTPPSRLEDLWGQLVEAVGRVSAFTRSYLIEAHPVSLARNVFTIGFDPEFEDQLGLVDNTKIRTLLQTKLKELGCGEVQVKFIKAEAPPGRVKPSADNASAATAPNPSGSPAMPAGVPASNQPPVAEPKREKTASSLSKEDFKNDPLIKEALEVFKGTIVEVRA
ncbi:MAG: DNA polymerase III subunit gamma/tau [Verrucomicrobiales bacterium]|nr:DNA polymerase III subunit gamma/tau [Verrucomicrobiales bacterium]